MLPSFSCSNVTFSAQPNITVCCSPLVVPLLNSVPNTISQCVAFLQLCHCYIQCQTKYHTVLQCLSCAIFTSSAQHNITVCCRSSVVPLLHSVPNTISQCVAVLQLCHCYIHCPTQYHSVLPSFSCANVTSSAQHNITGCCRPLVVPLLLSVPNKISQCVIVLQLCHCYIQCQHNIKECCRPSVVPLLHSVPNTISQCVPFLQLCHSYMQ